MHPSSEYCYANWFLAEKCNFRCFYCSVVNPQRPKRLIRKIKSVVSPSRRRYSLYDELDGVIERFLRTGRKITFGFTGGEPLIYPHFAEICKRLTSFDEFSISIDSNLSTDAIFRITESVFPEKVEYIFSALHVLERERVFGEIDSFIERVLWLKNEGYRIDVNYVMHPILFDRIERDYRYCLDKGLKLSIKKFKGVYQGKKYPASYTAEMKDYLRENFPSESSCDPFGSRNFLGRNCNSGMSIVNIWESGDITRCIADTTSLGNVYSGFDLNETAQPCIMANCPCFDPIRLFDDMDHAPEIGPLNVRIARIRQAFHVLKRVWQQS